MPRLRLATTLTRAQNDITRLESYLIQASPLGIVHQYFVGEVVMLRLFSVFEQSVREFALKLACNANYVGGTNPRLHQICTSMLDAENMMLTFGRPRPLVGLKWTKAKYIRENTENILHNSDHFLTEIRNNGALINEMRVVRNHIAHRTASTRQEFAVVLRQRYGANARLTPGAFLMSTKRNPVNNITRYIRSARTILRVVSIG